MSGHARERSEQNPIRSSAKSDDDVGSTARDARAASINGRRGSSLRCSSSVAWSRAAPTIGPNRVSSASP